MVLYNFLRQEIMSCSLECIHILGALDNWSDPEEVARQLWEFSAASIAAGLKELILSEAVVVEGSEQGLLDLEYEKSWRWGPLAGVYHFGTRDGQFLPEEEGERILRERARHFPSPPLYKTHLGDSRAVCAPMRRSYGEPFQTMARRRTNRGLLDRSIKLSQLSDCLLFSIAITGILKNPDIVDLPLKMTPSGEPVIPMKHIFARDR